MQATLTRIDRLRLTGAIDVPELEPWIARHAQRLGLSARVTGHDATTLLVEVAGPPDLLDAMEAGCLLGPIVAWVESIRREPLAGTE